MLYILRFFASAAMAILVIGSLVVWGKAIFLKIRAVVTGDYFSIMDKVLEWDDLFEGKMALVFTIVLVAFLATNSTIHLAFGYIDVMAKGEGTYCVWVEENGTKYKAQVSVDLYDIPYRNSYKTVNQVYLIKIIDNTGAEIWFEDNQFDSEGKVSATDDKGKIWDIKLTTQKAQSDKIKETTNYTYAIAELIVVFVLYAITMIALIIAKNKTAKQDTSNL